MDDFERRMPHHSIKILPTFDVTWPPERVTWWFATFFALLERCRDLQNEPEST